MISETLDHFGTLDRRDILTEEPGADSAASLMSGRELVMLEQIEGDPDVTQATLAAQLGVAVGTINWHIKRLVAKGYLKVKRAQRRKLRYIITPEGLAFRARLTVNYIETSLRLYRKTRQRVFELLEEVQKAGYDCIQIDGEGDIAEICRLTCLEQGIREVSNNEVPTTLPTLEVRGAKIILRYAPISVEEQ